MSYLMCFRLIFRFGTRADWSARIWEVPHVSKPNSDSGASVWILIIQSHLWYYLALWATKKPSVSAPTPKKSTRSIRWQSHRIVRVVISSTRPSQTTSNCTPIRTRSCARDLKKRGKAAWSTMRRLWRDSETRAEHVRDRVDRAGDHPTGSGPGLHCSVQFRGSC